MAASHETAPVAPLRYNIRLSPFLKQVTAGKVTYIISHVCKNAEEMERKTGIHCTWKIIHCRVVLHYYCYYYFRLWLTDRRKRKA